VNRRGFTAIELAIVISISAILVPLVYLFVRSVDEDRAVALWKLASADTVRTVSEQLRDDARDASLAADFTFTGEASCLPVRYVVTAAHTLERVAPAGCEGPRALAAGVSRLSRVEGGVELELELVLRPDHVRHERVFLALGGGR
jgi:prepilin-type N-terminal cleavage/methylation domain-containing protein